MDKYAKIAYINLILIILLSSFFVYKVFAGNTSEKELEEKTLSEVKYLEKEIQNLFNQMNNINFENYKIVVTEIEQKEEKSESSSSSKSSSGSGESSGSSQENSTSSENNKKYELEETGILTESPEIDWDQVKNDVAKIYPFLYSATVDLYQTSIDQEIIREFNKEYDNLTKKVKEENKEEVLMQLSKLYGFLPKFIEVCTNDEKEKIVINTKNEIFKAYSVLDKDDWNAISNNITKATDEFNKITTNVKIKELENQYNINKSYIIISELQNTVELKDKEIFLIKYKNLLEELQNI